MVSEVSHLFQLNNPCSQAKIRCEAMPDNLDGDYKNTRRRRHERTDIIIQCFDPGTVWDDYGIRTDVVVRCLNFSPVL
jgi:hypothetical protein